MAKPWTRAEINTLRENYGRMTYPKMAELLPGRTPGGIGTKASEMRLILGGKPPRHPKKSVPWHLRDAFQRFIEEIRQGMINSSRQEVHHGT